MNDRKKNRILNVARRIFDVVGESNEFLILGLESRQNRCLDDFIVGEDNKFKFPGFAKYFSPKIEALKEKIRENGLEANQVKDLNIKQLAIRAGIGKWGRNSLVIHPTFGPWLKFAVLKTNFQFSRTETPIESPIFEKCHDCDKCIKACPVSALKNFHIPERKRCIAYLELENPTKGLPRRCDACQRACQKQRP